jgi:sodium-dependent dicarboxylate transporter 2/3/5
MDKCATVGMQVQVQEAVSRYSLKGISVYLGPALFLLCVVLPPLPAVAEAAQAVGLSYASAPQYGLGVLLWTACWWIFETTPLGLAALVPVMLFGLSGILPWKEGLAPFMDPLIWVIMVGFLFAKSFQVWGLDKRVALTISSLSGTRNPALAGFFVASLPVFFLTITGSMTAATSIVYGFVIAFLVKQGFYRGSPYGSATLLALGQAATAGSLLFLTSTTTNLIGKKVILETTGVNLTFVDWFFVGSVHAFAGLLISWFIVYRVIRPEVRQLPFDSRTLRRELDSLGRVTRGEKITVGLLLFTLLLWIIPGLLQNLAIGDPGLKPLSDAVNGALPEAAPAVLAIFLFPLIRNDGRRMLEWDEILKGSVNWDVLFLVGGGITLGLGLMKCGFSEWVTAIFRSVIGGSPNEFVIFAACSLIGFLLSYPASNTGAASMACPLAASLSIAAGINPIGPVLGTAIATTIPSTLPSTTPAMAIAYSSGYVKMRDMVKVGLISDVIRFGLLILLGPPIIDWFLAFKGLL